MKKYFLTGTDTDAGKTVVSAALLKQASHQGKRAFGLKPIASGSEWQKLADDPQAAPKLRNQDALLHQAYSQPQQPYSIHNPLCFEPAIAPHIAAEQAAVPLSVDSLLKACKEGLTQTADFQIIEGAGGWLVPLNSTETLADFAKALQYPVILVVGLRLGCINHACLTAKAIQRDGLPIAGWVANNLSADMQVQKENLTYLKNWFAREEIAFLGDIPYLENLNAFDANQLDQAANCLSLPE